MINWPSDTMKLLPMLNCWRACLGIEIHRIKMAFDRTTRVNTTIELQSQSIGGGHGKFGILKRLGPATRGYVIMTRETLKILSTGTPERDTRKLRLELERVFGRDSVPGMLACRFLWQNKIPRHKQSSGIYLSFPRSIISCTVIGPRSTG
ncbi:hypothetical protein BDV19DRAFT_331983 [Aspergillus venezuelensis]